MMRKYLTASLLLLLILVAPLGAHAQQGGPVYIVQAGDTLSGIARTFGTSVEALLSANGLTNPNQLQPGQELALPGFEGVEGVLTTQTVTAGQSLSLLAARAGAEQSALARLNRVLHPGRIYIGQSIILPQASGAGAQTETSLRPYLVPADQGLLQYAAGRGQNPWATAQWIGDEPRLWWVSGEWAPTPVDGAESAWLPSPIKNLTITPRQAAQGETVVLQLTTKDPLEFDGSLAAWDLNFAAAEGGQVYSLQGVHAMTEPGLYELELQWRTPAGVELTGFQQPYPIRSGDYGFDPILIVPEETVGSENTVPEDELIAEVVSAVTPEKRWQGPFVWPSDHFVDSFPSVFGTRRNYNNTGYDYYHTGLDFYGGIGVEILAPAPGEVVLAEDLIVRGQTTVIDHGWGVFTLYMHQSEIMVEVGDQVETGQVIGLVGASGRVTGAHLHWEVRVGGVPVEPMDWVQIGYP